MAMKENQDGNNSEIGGGKRGGQSVADLVGAEI